MTIPDLVRQIREYFQRRRARRADNDLLAHIEFMERFLGPMDTRGQRPVSADDITVGQIDANDLLQTRGDKPWER